MGAKHTARMFAVLMVLAALPSPLKSELLPIRTYTTADGLASDRVNCIVPDSRGFLWFCTPEGLSRFDGYRFVTYGVEEGLPAAVVNALIETRSGVHWIGTPRGLSRIAASGGGSRFTNYRLGPEAAANNIAALLETRSGRIWAATEAGLFEWTDPRAFRHREFPGLERMTINTLAEDGTGNLWIGTTEGILVYGEDGVQKQRFTVRNGLPGDWVQMLLHDSKGRLWAALRGGLAMLTPDAAGSWRVEKVFSHDEGLKGVDVRAVLEASGGTLWIATQFGISRLSRNGVEHPVIENLTRAQGLSDRAILSLAEDPAGNIWAGAGGAGAMRIDRVGFTTYRERDGLRSDRVWAVFEDRVGEVLAVTIPEQIKRAHSVDIFDGARFHSMSSGPIADDPTWGWGQILLQSRTREWWVATNRGLCRFGPMKAADLIHSNPLTCYTSDIVFRIFEDSKGGVWASAQSKSENKLMRWDPRTDTVVHFPVPRIPGAPSGDVVSAFTEDQQGNIWMGLYKGGLCRFNSGTFQYFNRDDGLPAGSILALFAADDGLWIGSNGGGLGRMANTADQRPRIQIYDTARGMASNIVFCITDDREGRIYAGTGKGVDRLDPGTGHIRHFSTANGLAHGGFRAALRDRSGSLWFATTQGLSRLTPSADPPPAAPRVLITDLRIGGMSYPVSLLGETQLARLELRPSQNQLQVEFVGPDYEPGDVLRYSYKLEGADAGWGPPRSHLTVNYAALASGKYRFLVKAVTSEGVESQSPAAIDFTVLPPLWNRWWFEALALSLVGAVVLAAHRYRLTQMVNLERMRTAIATDLHDDIGASLSQIAILSEVARLNGNGQGTLERVAALARELVDSMSDIVWSIRSEPHGVDSLIRRMREFGLDLLTSQGIEFQLRTNETRGDVELSLQARRQMFLVFKECLHNAARHSRCTAVMAELKVTDREVALIVEDNGAGLSRGEDALGAAGGTGIANMRRRAESLGGRMQLTSKPGDGVRVAIHIPTQACTIT